MPQRQHVITSYTIDDHPDPDKVYTWINHNWHELFDGSGEVHALEQFADTFDIVIADCELSLCSHSYVHFDKEYGTGEVLDSLKWTRLWKWLSKRVPDDPENCPMTGCYMDDVLLEPIRVFLRAPEDITLRELLRRCERAFVTAYINAWSGTYEDEYLHDHCLANDYYFLPNGEHYS